MPVPKRYIKLKKLGICAQCCIRPSISGRIRCYECVARHREVKYKVLREYGGKCGCCGITEMLVLTLDHLNNDGASDRKRRKASSNDPLYAHLHRLLREGKDLPKIYGVKCFNCNCGINKNNEVCPHNSPVNIGSLTKLRKLHKNVIIKYGGMCTGCGETELGFLTIEHINGGGREHVRSKFKGQNYRFYKHLRDSIIQDDITILCFNCNCKKWRIQ